MELHLEKKPFRHSLDVSPSGFIHRSQPIDLIFRVTRGFTGRGPGAVRWRVRPQGQVRSVILFTENAFPGNFRVPTEHLAIQWDVEAAYRRSELFFCLLEIWKKEKLKKTLKLFSLGLDIPILVFFHLLCLPQYRRSGATMTGDWEQVWRAVELLEDPDRLVNADPLTL